jgi:tRNA G18 (ribose-2'-O)-methylase SpoU
MAGAIEAAAQAGAPVYLAARDVFDRIAGFHVHRGVLAIAGRRPEPDPIDLARSSRAILVIEGVNDHENLGALFRNAAALGADAVLMDPTCCDPLYRRSVRVSIGHVLRVPFARFDGGEWPAAGITDLRRLGFAVVALRAQSGEDVLSIDDLADLAEVAGRRIAIMVGAEGPGLSPAAAAAATHVARVPMAGGVDSLNVATAAAVALHRLVPAP